MTSNRRKRSKKPDGKSTPRNVKPPQGEQGPKLLNPRGRNFLIWAAIILSAVIIAQMLSESSEPRRISFTEFERYMEEDLVAEAEITGHRFVGLFNEPQEEYYPTIRGRVKRSVDKFTVILPPNVDSDMLEKWNEHGLIYEFKEPTIDFMDVMVNFFPWILIIVIWFMLMRRMQGGGGQSGIFGFAKSRAKIISPDNPEITFKDVAGCDEAKVELEEIVEFLKNPKRYSRLGAKIPKGALLLGPPGTGKTLLARAVSGEAGVPFFSISGAEFVEMFVGVGASRVRDLFDQAKRNSPSIIFVDEIDAVGRHRGAGLGGGHDEREQTLNQILVEMDGFDTDDNVILLAATNRPDVLDKALLRPGRFDRQIVVDIPGINGREAILKIHTRKIPLAKDVDLKPLAKGTPGLVGADLENLCNEAALLAARRKKRVVTMGDFEDAKDKVMMGVERKSMILTPDERKITAYHEAGHAMVAHYSKHTDPIHKITIIPRGRALGITSQLPESEKHNYTRKYLLGQLNVLMGGRSAEKLVFRDTSTGAGNDIERATKIARSMVCEWGMSSKIGPLTFGKKNEEVFLGREIAQARDHSDDMSKLIDQEISSLVKQAEKDADRILSTHREELDRLARTLLDYETISGEEMNQIISGKDIERQKPSDDAPRKKRTRRRKPKPKTETEKADAAPKKKSGPETNTRSPQAKKETGEKSE